MIYSSYVDFHQARSQVNRKSAAPQQRVGHQWGLALDILVTFGGWLDGRARCALEHSCRHGYTDS